MIDHHQPWSLQRRALLAGLAGVAATTATGGKELMAAIEQNTLKRRGVGLRACEPERAFPGFTLFAPHFVENSNVYLIDPRSCTPGKCRTRPACPAISPSAGRSSTTGALQRTTF